MLRARWGVEGSQPCCQPLGASVLGALFLQMTLPTGAGPGLQPALLLLKQPADAKCRHTVLGSVCPLRSKQPQDSLGPELGLRTPGFCAPLCHQPVSPFPAVPQFPPL